MPRSCRQSRARSARGRAGRRLTVGALPERFGLEVDVHRPGKRVRDDERRRREVVRLDLGVDARLEVAVPRQHRAGDEVALRIACADLVRQRAGVADARRAAVADRVEAELVEIRCQVGVRVVLGDDPRARRERRLDPGLALQAALDRLLGDEAGGEHHGRVRRVGARRDGARSRPRRARARTPRRRRTRDCLRLARSPCATGHRRLARARRPVAARSSGRGGERVGDRLVV